MIRTLIGMDLREPTRTISLSCKTRSNLTCIGKDRSPISSKNKVPLWAASNQPTRLLIAPVKAPFSCPNNSLSTNDSVKAPQFTAINGPLARWLNWWIWRATNSLPVPVSPMMSALASLGAICSIRDNNACDNGSAKTVAVARLCFSAEGTAGWVKIDISFLIVVENADHDERFKNKR